MFAPLLKLLGEKVKQLALGTLTNCSCMVPEAPAQLIPQLLATAFGHSSVIPALEVPAGPSAAQVALQLFVGSAPATLSSLCPDTLGLPWVPALPGQLRCVCTSLLPR